MADAAEPRDVELLRRLVAGDESAFLGFYKRHQGGIYRFALHMTGRPEAAADLVQETFMTLILEGRRYDEGRGAPAAFLYGIARNHVRRLIERESRFVPFAEETRDGNSANGNGRAPEAEIRASHEPAFDVLARDEAVRELRLAVLRLPHRYREVITLCDLEGRSYAEAAALLECPVGTVRSRLNRGRDMLADKLRPAGKTSRSLAGKWGGRT